MCSVLQTSQGVCKHSSGSGSVEVTRNIQSPTQAPDAKSFHKSLPDVQYTDFCRHMLQDLQCSRHVAFNSNSDQVSKRLTCTDPDTIDCARTASSILGIVQQRTREGPHRATTERESADMASPLPSYSVTTSGKISQKAAPRESFPGTAEVASFVNENGITDASAHPSYYHKDKDGTIYRSHGLADSSASANLSRDCTGSFPIGCNVVGDLYSNNNTIGLHYCSSSGCCIPGTSSLPAMAPGALNFGQYFVPSGSQDYFFDQRTAVVSRDPCTAWNAHASLSSDATTGDNNHPSQASGSSLGWSSLDNIVIPTPTRVLSGSMDGKDRKVVLDKPEDLVPSSFLKSLGKPPARAPTRGRQSAPITDTELVVAGLKRNCRSGKQKPSYLEMVATALVSAPDYSLPLCKIYDFLPLHFPHIADLQTKSWRNSVRHSLSSQPCFTKEPGSTRTHAWKLHEACVRDFRAGIFDSGVVKKRVKEFTRNSTPAQGVSASQPDDVIFPLPRATLATASRSIAGLATSSSASSGICSISGASSSRFPQSDLAQCVTVKHNQTQGIVSGISCLWNSAENSGRDK